MYPVAKRQQAPPDRRCKATTKRGTPCAATVVGPDGLCSAHSGRQDMRALGHRGGKARRKGVAEQLPDAERASLREQLRRGLDPELVVRTANEILAGENQTARGNMIRFLADLELYRKDGDECPRCAAMRANGPANRAKVDEMIARYVEFAVRAEMAGAEEKPETSSQATRLVRAAVRKGLEGHEAALEAAVETLLRKIVDRIASGVVVDNDVDAERAAAIFEVLEERGLIVGRGKVEEMAEARAMELLAAIKQEHGIPA
jgi:hypothetical protein